MAGKQEPTEEMLTDSDSEEHFVDCMESGGEDTPESSDEDWSDEESSSDCECSEDDYIPAQNDTPDGPARRLVDDDDEVIVGIGDWDDNYDDGESDYSDHCSVASEEPDLQEELETCDGDRQQVSHFSQQSPASEEEMLPESTFKPGPCLSTPLTEPIDAVMLYLRPILHLVTMYTNAEAEKVYKEKDQQWVPVDETEMSAFLGILIIAGALNSAMEIKRILWSTMMGPAFFRSTMSLRRFKEIQTHMRFDDRSMRDKNDAFSPFREIWTIFADVLKQYYVPGENLTVGKQFIPHKGLCGFKQCLPDKEDKSYIKFWWLCDSKSFYPLCGTPYLGKQDKPTKLGPHVVMDLIQYYKGSYRNVTCDNYFTDLVLSQELLSVKLSLVGAVHQSSLFIPPEFEPNYNRKVHTSLFGYRENTTLVSYVPSKRTAMILLSTKHNTGDVNAVTGKPEILESYNETKGGVKTFVKRLREYSCRQKTRRWPMVCFYNVIDVACFAAYVIWNMEHPDWNSGKHDHQTTFLLEVCEKLVHPNVLRRLQYCRNEGTLQTIKQVLRSLHKKEKRKQQGPPLNCRLCPSKSHHRTRQICSTCSVPVCKQHSRVTSICTECKSSAAQ